MKKSDKERFVMVKIKNGWDGYPLMRIHFDADM